MQKERRTRDPLYKNRNQQGNKKTINEVKLSNLPTYLRGKFINGDIGNKKVDHIALEAFSSLLAGENAMYTFICLRIFSGLW